MNCNLTKEQRDFPSSDTLLVGFDHNPKKDTTVLVVGKQRINQSVQIINAFQGEEARELYQKLITVNKKEEEENNV